LNDGSRTTRLPASSEVQGEILDASPRKKGFEVTYLVDSVDDAAQQFMADPVEEMTEAELRGMISEAEAGGNGTIDSPPSSHRRGRTRIPRKK